MDEQAKKKGAVVIVSGPSGVGKSTICKEVVRRTKTVHLSVSVTTRAKGDGEVEDADYRFVTREEFQRYIEKGELLEYAEVFGSFYGTPKDQVDEALESGETIILEIDVQGARQVKQIYKEAEMIFILPPSQRELAERMSQRDRETAEMAEERLGEADDEIAVAWQYYEHMVINDDLEEAINEVIRIIDGSQS